VGWLVHGAEFSAKQLASERAFGVLSHIASELARISILVNSSCDRSSGFHTPISHVQNEEYG
jgi:hypothetical protein